MDTFMDERDVLLGCEARDEQAVFESVGCLARDRGVVRDALRAREDLFEREREQATGLCDGFAIPHAKSGNVLRPAVFYVRTVLPVPWQTFDGKGVQHFFALMVPERDAGETYLRMLSSLAVGLMDDSFKEGVRAARTQEEIVRLTVARLKA